MFHGPIKEAVPFFESMGFRCPERKDHASFLQEVTTPKGKLPSIFARLPVPSLPVVITLFHTLGPQALTCPYVHIHACACAYTHMCIHTSN